MVDYRKMYLRLVDEVERILDILDSSRDLEQKVFLSQALLAAGLHTAVASGSWCGAERQRCGASGSPLMWSMYPP